VSVADATRLAYVALHEGEKARTAPGFLNRAIQFYAARGVTVHAEGRASRPGCLIKSNVPRYR